MPSYLVETYLANGDALDGRLERAIHIPEDELCFYVVDAASGSEAALAARRAGLDPIRVVEAVVVERRET
jgi:hypothetical protein